jgi:DNA-binding transcriptional LysR family regulator
VTASEFVGAEVLPAILTTFRTPQPKIDIELWLSNHNQDLTRRDADIAVGMAVPTQKSLIARKLGDVSVGLWPFAVISINTAGRGCLRIWRITR